MAFYKYCTCKMYEKIIQNKSIRENQRKKQNLKKVDLSNSTGCNRSNGEVNQQKPPIYFIIQDLCIKVIRSTDLVLSAVFNLKCITLLKAFLMDWITNTIK